MGPTIVLHLHCIRLCICRPGFERPVCDMVSLPVLVSNTTLSQSLWLYDKSECLVRQFFHFFLYLHVLCNRITLSLLQITLGENGIFKIPSLLIYKNSISLHLLKSFKFFGENCLVVFYVEVLNFFF